MTERPVSTSLFTNNGAHTAFYTLSLHDALPICAKAGRSRPGKTFSEILAMACAIRLTFRCLLRTACGATTTYSAGRTRPTDRKSTRLNSSHVETSYAVFCL